jgi:hypothetical protein
MLGCASHGEGAQVMAKFSRCNKNFRLGGQKTGQVLVRTFRTPGRAEGLVISGEEVWLCQEI